ncbi:unnamed protein product [Polarella glacialis]|uniref:Uncharacterized protein n=1 Tax=Polarella glacialis TaxID=89957 RepID=A0A813JA60_POLGL|nr:unnamed protein product [Polarella glacialis]
MPTKACGPSPKGSCLHVVDSGCASVSQDLFLAFFGRHSGCSEEYFCGPGQLCAQQHHGNAFFCSCCCLAVCLLTVRRDFLCLSARISGFGIFEMWVCECPEPGR